MDKLISQELFGIDDPNNLYESINKYLNNVYDACFNDYNFTDNLNIMLVKINSLSQKFEKLKNQNNAHKFIHCDNIKLTIEEIGHSLKSNNDFEFNNSLLNKKYSKINFCDLIVIDRQVQQRELKGGKIKKIRYIRKTGIKKVLGGATPNSIKKILSIFSSEQTELNVALIYDSDKKKYHLITNENVLNLYYDVKNCKLFKFLFI